MRYYISNTFHPNYSETIPDEFKSFFQEEDCVYNESVPAKFIEGGGVEIGGWEEDYYPMLQKKVSEVTKKTYMTMDEPWEWWEWKRAGKRYFIDSESIDNDLISALGGKVNLFDAERYDEDGLLLSIFGEPQIEGMVMEIDNGYSFDFENS